MKFSLRKLFGTLQINVLMVVALMVLNTLVLLSMNADYERIDKVERQKSMIQSVMDTDLSDFEFARIEIEGTLNRLEVMVQFQYETPAYDFIYPFLQPNPKKLEHSQKKLEVRLDTVKQKALNYLNATANERKRAMIRLESASRSYSLALFESQSFIAQTLKSRTMLLFAIMLFTLLWSLLLFGSIRKTSVLLMKDLFAVMQVDNPKIVSQFETQEINAIALKLRQNSGEAFNPTLQDAVTQLYNYDGMLRMYNQRFLKKQGQQHIFVCIFEIDNYTKLVNHYPDSVIHPILTKMSSLFNLHKQQNDIVSRIDDSHFLIVMSRNSKEKALQECESIRAAIDVKKFKVPNNAFRITLSGGFAAKTMAQSIDDAIKNAREYLQIAIKKGRNRVAEMRDHTEVI